MMDIRDYTGKDAHACAMIWNEVVQDGVAFPQLDLLSDEEAHVFFTSQTRTRVAVDDSDTPLGLYILHPNNVGRCGHIANTSYAVCSTVRGLHLGESLVSDSLLTAKEEGFRILQFNAVVATNAVALHIYEKLGFVRLGVIPGGFLLPSGEYADIIPQYHLL